MSPKTLAVSGFYPGTFCSKPVPAVRLQGRWLESLGFSIGGRVEVLENQEEIVIRVVREVGSNGKDKIHDKHRR